MSTEKKQESWVSIAQRCPLQNSPVTAANIAQMEIPFKVYLDDQMQWRNAHTKLVIVDVAWWLEALPEFPLTSFPVSNPMQLISELNDKLLELSIKGLYVVRLRLSLHFRGMKRLIIGWLVMQKKRTNNERM